MNEFSEDGAAQVGTDSQLPAAPPINAPHDNTGEQTLVIPAPEAVNNTAIEPPAKKPRKHRTTKFKPGGKQGVHNGHKRKRSTKGEVEREMVTTLVIVGLVAGKTNDQIAEELGINFSTVLRIRENLPEEFIEFFSTAKTNEISGLIEELLKAQLVALRKMVAVTDDEVWLKAQRAPEIATFFGVVNDKTVRLLSAIERANEREREWHAAAVSETREVDVGADGRGDSPGGTKQRQTAEATAAIGV